MGKTTLPCVLSMTDNIYGLSLGTLVRQMMCGIVFFIPIVLWKQNSNWDSIVDWLRNWSATGLIAFGAVAACIGTLIYHVEKNLWAYFWQFVRLLCRRREPKNDTKAKLWKFLKVIPLALAVLTMLVVLLYLSPISVDITLCILFIILFIMFPIALFTGERKVLVKYTQNMWRAASKLPDDFVAFLQKSNADTKTILELYEVKEIARREAGWADYIHCGQTAAFSWILSCLLIWGIEGSCPGTSLKWFVPSLLGAVWLLGFEMLCEIHKQMHIDRLLAKYGKLKKEIGTK